MEAGHGVSADEFRWVFNQYWAPVRAYVLRRSPEAATVDDVVAEVFATAWRRRDQIPSGRELAWLCSVAANMLKNAQRGYSRRERLIGRLTSAARTESQHAPGPEGLSDHEDAGARVRDALAQLSEADAEVLRLANWEGLTRDEIAVVLDCTPNAVGIRLHRARRRLAVAMGLSTAEPGPTGDEEVAG